METIFITLNLALAGCGGSTPVVSVVSATVTPAPAEPLAPTAPVPTPAPIAIKPLETVEPVPTPAPIEPPVDTPPLDPPPLPVPQTDLLWYPHPLVLSPQIEQAAPVVQAAPIVVPPVEVAPPITLPYAGFSIIDVATSNTMPLQFYFMREDLLAIKNTLGAAQYAAFETAVKNAQVLIGATGYTTLDGLGITYSIGPALNYVDATGASRSVPSIVLTNAAGVTLAPVIWLSSPGVIAPPVAATILVTTGSNVMLINIPLGTPGRFPYSAFSLGVNGVIRVFHFQNADIATANTITNVDDETSYFQQMMLRAADWASDNHATLESLGFTAPAVSTQVIVAPAGTAVSNGLWFLK